MSSQRAPADDALREQAQQLARRQTRSDFVYPTIARIGSDAPLDWLGRAIGDMRAMPGPSLFYGIVLAVMGFLFTRYSSGAVGLAFTTGFLLIGPFLAIGLYDLSRQREHGVKPSLAASLAAWRTNLPAIGLYALLLTLLLAVWIRVSIVVVAAFFPKGAVTLAAIAQMLSRSPEAWVFLLAYLAAGCGFALFVYATSVVSLPMLLGRRDMDALTAMITSFTALRRNFVPLLVWALLIVILAVTGFGSAYVGLVITMPLIGHATWHAYRALITFADEAPEAAPPR